MPTGFMEATRELPRLKTVVLCLSLAIFVSIPDAMAEEKKLNEQFALALKELAVDFLTIMKAKEKDFLLGDTQDQFVAEFVEKHKFYCMLTVQEDEALAQQLKDEVAVRKKLADTLLAVKNARAELDMPLLTALQQNKDGNLKVSQLGLALRMCELKLNQISAKKKADQK